MNYGMRKLTYRFLSIEWDSDTEMTTQINSLVFENEEVIHVSEGEEGLTVLVRRHEPEVMH